MDPRIKRLQLAAKAGDQMALECLVHLAAGLDLKSAPRYDWKPSRIEIKAIEGRRISAYLLTYEPPERCDSYGDIIAQGACTSTLAKIAAAGGTLAMHDDHLSKVGVWDLLEDDPEGARSEGRIKGLYAEGDIEAAHVEGVLTETKGEGLRCSIGYITRRFELLDGLGGRDLALHWDSPIRRLLEIELIEGSLTRWPINRYAEVLEIKSRRLAEWKAVVDARLGDDAALLEGLASIEAQLQLEIFGCGLARQIRRA